MNADVKTMYMAAQMPRRASVIWMRPFRKKFWRIFLKIAVYLSSDDRRRCPVPLPMPSS